MEREGYKNLLVYQKSKDLSKRAFIYFYKLKYDRRIEFLVNQLLRSITSIGANIAEGYGRHYSQSYRQFLAVARGSAFETQYWLELMIELNVFDNTILIELTDQTFEIAKMLTALMKKLQSSKDTAHKT